MAVSNRSGSEATKPSASKNAALPLPTGCERESGPQTIDHRTIGERKVLGIDSR